MTQNAPRPRVAYLACSTTMPGSADRREDAFEHDLLVGVLGRGLHYAGRTLHAVSWDDPAADWAQYEAAIIGTTWDYVARLPEFLAALDRIAGHTLLLNPSALVSWNASKTYLRDLGELGVPVIPTLWLNAPNAAACDAAYATLDTDTLILKPQVGAGAWRQVRLQRGDPWPGAAALPLGPTMVQAFVPSIVSEGEYSFLFFNGQFSHAVRKRPAAGDYRIQSSFGGTDTPYAPTATDLDAAHAVLAAARHIVPGPMLYARVDMVQSAGGELLLIELELIEPYLYPLHAPEMSKQFADAYLSLLASSAGAH